MNKPADAARPILEIRFGQVGLAQLRLRATDPDLVREQLAARMAAAPQLFERAGVCLDLSALEHEPQTPEVRAVLEAVRGTGMLPVGLAHGTAAIDALARELELPVLTLFRAQSKTAAAPGGEEPKAPPPTPAEVPARAPALMHHHPVRSGQRLYARHRDLVVTTVVGAGAEVMSDGCVHVYGALRGRAMAGVRGELSARVFCQEFHAELVAVAGVFRIFETIPEELAGKPVQAWLDGDDLRFARIGG